ncbi:cysteine rich repeat-containing protein [Roseomonas sp. HJA6]|uniref:Cysteine rich repeat-containing protein n=1 Tax=Roseomonas alba TaxID=2846776 RepID=A0ABS7ACL3_9PROT|nr:cysteine rich repeat-containing protein [Neoroseomonas alba]MBW6400048.1 cysteine rich repeat-containing protein [Neoroseomonas alba]
MSMTPIGRAVLPALAALAALPLFIASPASAQGAMSPAQRQAAQACMPDIRAYCSGVERGGGRIIACLRQNNERLSDNCRQALSGAQR